MTDVVERLRIANAKLDEARAAAARAIVALSDGAEIFDAVTRTSVWPQVAAARQCAADAAEDVRLGVESMNGAQGFINTYCIGIAGYGLGDSMALDAEDAITPGAAERLAHDDIDRESFSDEEWIARVRRSYPDVDPSAVVRISRDRDGRPVRLEDKTDREGVGHILGKSRIGDFEAMGVPAERVVDLIFAALAYGKIVGYVATDRPVYELEFDGRIHRVAITVINGAIVGANPVPVRRKIRPNRYRFDSPRRRHGR
ncbi:hypothetical protein [Actinoalloteichus fjordicus]|uniref:hypothetical protein n=1 Tax=Actinoalloteichus fjordicus TaxID=1612552 RepID=UPI0012FA688A|nr:hypothetical protein [Actinoalloteichus fjordicus]